MDTECPLKVGSNTSKLNKREFYILEFPDYQIPVSQLLPAINNGKEKFHRFSEISIDIG